MDEYIGLMRTGIELGITRPIVILQGRDKPIKAQLVDRGSVTLDILQDEVRGWIASQIETAGNLALSSAV